MLIFTITILSILILIPLYFMIQFTRNTKVYEIRKKWIHNKDSRYEKYSYHEMISPSSKNYLGFMIPKEEHFK